ncbi:MAG: FAD-dependent oxidoreductase [Mailhella sp.]|nr:FAD-dependent oxidoreductase [Mailhella sp.]
MNSSNIAVNANACLACGKCVDHCIMDNLRLVLPPCRQASPLGINYQGILRLTAAGKPAEAAKLLRSCTPFGGFLAVWGDKAASQACSRSRKGGALDMARVLSWLVQREESAVYSADPDPYAHSCKTVAVIGSGPAGLQAAHDLRRKGYAITVYEAAPSIGSTLRFLPSGEGSSPAEGGILPSIPAEIMDKTIAMLLGMGIDIRTFSPKGQSELDELCKTYDAVLCASGKGSVLPADDLGWVRDNLFAAGACVKNQKQIGTLQAMASGAKAARTICNFLEGFSLDYESDQRTARGLERFHGLSDAQEDTADMPAVKPSAQEYSDAEAASEASRCLGCGSPAERNQTCWYCLPCEVVCPTHALYVRVPYLVR